jgi:predicted  nucleic acid-binding Zn-ribbon protein
VATDLQSELSAMVQEMQNLEKALGELGTLVTASSTKLQQIESQTDALVQTGTNAVQHHEDDLQALGTQVHTTADQFKTDIGQVGQNLQAESTQLSSAAEKAFTLVDALVANVGHLSEAGTAHSQELTQLQQQFSELAKKTEDALSSHVQATTQSVTEGVQKLGEVGQKWEQKGAEVAHSVSDAIHQTSDHVDQKLIAPLDESLKSFTDLTKQIEDAVLSNPMQALSDKLKDAIISEAQKEIEAVAAELEKVIEDAIHSLSDAGGGNDAINKEVHAIFAELQPLWDKLTDALRSVQSIWDTVKGAVEAL